jgi:peptidoglycan-associated lipoprotein
MKTFKRLWAVISFLFTALFMAQVIFMFGGCAPRKVVQAEKAEAPEEAVAKQEEVKPQEPEKVIQPKAEVITEKPVTETPAVTEKVAKKEEPELLLTPPTVTEKIEFPDVHFDFDKYDIRDDAKPVLEKLAQWLKNNPKARVLIEGHCDERGTNQYNLALGERRASATKNYLMALGISSSRIDTVTYGEERPLCREQTEECWQLNRRAHFVIHE